METSPEILKEMMVRLDALEERLKSMRSENDAALKNLSTSIKALADESKEQQAEEFESKFSKEGETPVGQMGIEVPAPKKESGIFGFFGQTKPAEPTPEKKGPLGLWGGKRTKNKRRRSKRKKD